MALELVWRFHHHRRPIGKTRCCKRSEGRLEISITSALKGRKLKQAVEGSSQ